MFNVQRLMFNVQRLSSDAAVAALFARASAWVIGSTALLGAATASLRAASFRALAAVAALRLRGVHRILVRLLDGSLAEVGQLVLGELARGTCAQLQCLDVLRHREVGRGRCPDALQTHGEDGQIL